MHRETFRLFIVQEREKAYLFSTVQNNSSGRDGDQFWCPRSQVERITKLKEFPGQWRECEVELTEWLAREKGLL